jgi:hypothetical protein
VSLTKNELLYLMAYADGEVDDDEIPEVEALIAKSEEAKAVMRQQEALRQWTLDAAEGVADKGRASKIADRVMDEIEELGGAKVITLERERARRALNQQRVKEFGALAAVAAVVALFFFWPSGAPDKPAAVADRGAKIPNSSTASAPAATLPHPPASDSAAAVAAGMEAAEPEPPGVDIEAVESPQHQFSIFYVPGAPNAAGASAQASSVVVWIGE